MRSQDHMLRLFLHGKIRLALLKLQSEKELGQSYGALYALTEGLHTLNYLKDKDYETFKKRYSVKLVEEEQDKPEIDPQAQKEIQNMTRTFEMVLDQWRLHPNSEWRSKWLKKAAQYANRIPAAEAVLALAKNTPDEEAKR